MDIETKTLRDLLTFCRRNRGACLLMLLAIILLVLLMSIYLPSGNDWSEVYYPSGRKLIAGQNPYDVEGLFNPVWALIPILPGAVFSENIGRALYLLISIIGFSVAAVRMGAGRSSLIAFLLSPVVLHCLLNGNVDWMPLVGFTLPPQLGMFFVLVKPQMSFIIIIFWLIESWRQGGYREVVRIFWPSTVALLASFLIFGFWPTLYLYRLNSWWNASLWPMSIPVGLALFAAAIRLRKKEFAMGAAPCLSPYVLFHSWSGALLAIVAYPVETIAAVAGLWLLVVIRFLG